MLTEHHCKIQTEPTGVVDAIHLGWKEGVPNLVTFADNVYDPEEVAREHCASMRVLHNKYRTHLFNIDGLSFAGWASSSFKPHKPFEQWILDLRHLTLTNEWWDIGTPETYYDYWLKGTI